MTWQGVVISLTDSAGKVELLKEISTHEMRWRGPLQESELAWHPSVLFSIGGEWLLIAGHVRSDDPGDI